MKKNTAFFRSTVTATSVVLSLLAFSATANAATLVDLELSLLADISGSVDNSEFNLQRQGYASAFNSSTLWDAIAQGAIGKIAVNYIEWSGSNEQKELVGWTLIDSYAAAQSFASAILVPSRPFFGSTAPGSAIAFATPGFSSNAFDGTRWVIDVSGDGVQNSGVNTALARDNALAAGVHTINGLVIGSDPGVSSFYQNNVIGGTNPFVVQANDFNDFGSAIGDKLQKEIVNPVEPNVPEPLTILSSGLALGFGTLLKMRKSKLENQ